MKRRHLQSTLVFCTQNLSEIVILKGKASMLFFRFGLISLENVTLVIHHGEHLLAAEERTAVLCSCFWPLSGMLSSVAPGQGPATLCPRSPGSCRRAVRERRGLLVCQVMVTAVRGNCWCGLCASGRTESWCCAGVIRVGHSGNKSLAKWVSFWYSLVKVLPFKWKMPTRRSVIKFKCCVPHPVY